MSIAKEARAILEEDTKARKKRQMELRFEHFIKEWAPKDRYDAARFNAELLMLVNEVHLDAGEAPNRWMMEVARSLPIAIPSIFVKK